MSNDLNIVNAALVMPEGVKTGSVGIRGGVITEVCDNAASLPPARETIDAAGLLLFPGMIDSHVHIRGGALGHREDFTTGSFAAVAGGITTILEMPNCATPASSLDNYLFRKAEVARDGCLNFGMYGGAGADNLTEIPKLAEAGAIGFKSFHMAPVRGREREFYGLCAQTYEDLIAMMKAVQKTELPVTIHCESQQMVDELETKFTAEGRSGLKAFCASRPPESEMASVKIVLRAAMETGCRVIVAHVSCPETAEYIETVKQRGYPVYSESCAHYLCFDEGEMAPFGVFARMKPPWRDRGRVNALRQLYAQGVIDITGSDHAPYTREEKLRNGDDIWRTIDGLYGLQMTLPLLLKLTEEGHLTYERIAAAFSENTARIFGLRGKGRIEAGCDADLVLVRKLSQKIPSDIGKFFIKSRDAAVIYDNIPLGHAVEKTLLAGKVVYDNGAISLKAGNPVFLSPERAVGNE